MKKGPRWSEDSVNVLLLLVRDKVEAIDEMDDGRLDKECSKRLETERFVGKSREIKMTALKDWVWRNAKGYMDKDAVEPETKAREPVLNDVELEKVLELLKNHGSATEGGIRSMLFKGREKIFEPIMEWGYSTGKIKKTKTTSGTEVITAA